MISKDYAQPAFEFMERAYYEDYSSQKEKLGEQLRILEKDAEEFKRFREEFDLLRD